MRVFVTGASGWIGSAVVPELIAHDHTVAGLARSDAAAEKLAAAGAEVVRGDIDDLDVLRSAAAAGDGVIHLAFRHDIAFSGDYAGAAASDRAAIEALGEALAGSDRPLVIAGGLAAFAGGPVATEDAEPEPSNPIAQARHANEQLALGLAGQGVRGAVVRLAPTVHGEGDHGFIASLVATAREKGAAGYVGDGSNHWTAVHRSDAARLFRLALEQAPAGTVLHAADEQGVPMRDIAAVFARHLDVPLVSVEDPAAHFGWLAGFVGLDMQASSALTRERFGWEPTGPGLLEDLEQGHYFRSPPQG